uniref:Uncharacterized protein n=1 Tax=Romanomermis culicivorax TaxID=13658 RepID=A0A915L025_ROMCU
MYKWCCSDVYKTVTNLFIKEEQNASWDGTTALSTLGEVVVLLTMRYLRIRFLTRKSNQYFTKELRFQLQFSISYFTLMTIFGWAM